MEETASVAIAAPSCRNRGIRITLAPIPRTVASTDSEDSCEQREYEDALLTPLGVEDLHVDNVAEGEDEELRGENAERRDRRSECLTREEQDDVIGQDHETDHHR